MLLNWQLGLILIIVLNEEEGLALLFIFINFALKISQLYLAGCAGTV